MFAMPPGNITFLEDEEVIVRKPFQDRGNIKRTGSEQYGNETQRSRRLPWRNSSL